MIGLLPPNRRGKKNRQTIMTTMPKQYPQAAVAVRATEESISVEYSNTNMKYSLDHAVHLRGHWQKRVPILDVVAAVAE
jgi:hypothetical protein